MNNRAQSNIPEFLNDILNETLGYIPDEDSIHKILNDPQFNMRIKTHDWRNYVPDGLVQQWQALSCEARICTYLIAEDRASREEWS